jgi:DNA-directed RNA polymerase alpha subunit
MNTPLPASIGRPATNALGSVGITSLEELCKISEKELTELHGVGPKAIGILKNALDESKLCLLAPEIIKPTGIRGR